MLHAKSPGKDSLARCDPGSSWTFFCAGLEPGLQVERSFEEVRRPQEIPDRNPFTPGDGSQVAHQAGAPGSAQVTAGFLLRLELRWQAG